LPQDFKHIAVNRIIDANINRSKEGLRVCEEVGRFILNDRGLTSDFKRIRHEIDAIIKKIPAAAGQRLQARQSAADVGKSIHAFELKRKDFQDIFFANIQRVKESVRVLEEFSKLMNKTLALSFKSLRYDIYEVEKRAAKRITSVSDR
jgi:thiamine-phosphate pyrophosphorylase